MRKKPSRCLLAVLLGVFVLLSSGCASSTDPSSRSSSSAKKADAVIAVRDVDAPKPDKDLDQAVGSQAKVLTKAGCKLGIYDIAEAEHVKKDADLKAISFPQTSGAHYEHWAPFGLYTAPIKDGYAVHNLEHGGVVVWTGVDVDEATKSAVAGLLDQGEKWVVAPRPDISGLFSAAWGAGLSCPPKALDTLGPARLATALDAWYNAVVSTGSPAEKDVPPYAGAMKEPTPKRDISTEAPY